MRLVAAYIGMLVTMAAVEAVGLPLLILPLFEREIPALMAAEIDYVAVAIFYLLYPAGALYFAVAPAIARGAPAKAARDGALFGFFAYLTYEATNMATLEGWSWTLFVTDIAWGTVLTGLVSLAGFLAAGLAARRA